MKLKTSLLATGLILSLFQVPTFAQSSEQNSAANLNDLEIAHVAYVADNIDIRYAKLALKISKDPAIRDFAETMIRDHTAVNEQALALLAKLKVEPQDNFLSQSLNQNSEKLVAEMSKLSGAAFDKRYAENELAYHKAVNDLVENAFIPNIDNADVKALFVAGLDIFKAHESHAAKIVEQVGK